MAFNLGTGRVRPAPVNSARHASGNAVVLLFAVLLPCFLLPDAFTCSRTRISASPLPRGAKDLFRSLHVHAPGESARR